MKCTNYSCPILIKLEFQDKFLKNTQIPNFMKIHSVGPELFHVDILDKGKSRSLKFSGTHIQIFSWIASWL